MCNVLTTKSKIDKYTSSAPTPKPKPRCANNNNYNAIFNNNKDDEKNTIDMKHQTPLQDTKCL